MYEKKNHSTYHFLGTAHKQMHTKAIRSTLQSPIILCVLHDVM